MIIENTSVWVPIDTYSIIDYNAEIKIMEQFNTLIHSFGKTHFANKQAVTQISINFKRNAQLVRTLFRN